ncbi:MAG: autotransporter outer membrane beta-barrel domain-containing protein [Saprospiraceae bacterium]|nr:autotransporter outer membrane beta-barrel domain-containing protein [Saprospiraceae bacterium]HMW39140.1 autotransporter outer membrane beta-barrel domain-containing protein [Saprospiraceae bacterium]HMX89643.1 autotransporter outer membrane beta-barrel domain-containing protein [Saprospiraceae bacterium]HMZ40658.1 autotransporter outer membrane beta-barrel domain-containing protein [Saprospiraceae bacterium]HNA65242.1 autotransporter outer membrane beta-barrel domain-containing protein [Sa
MVSHQRSLQHVLLIAMLLIGAGSRVSSQDTTGRWHFTLAAGLIEQQTTYAPATLHGDFLNGWRLSLGARRYFSHLYVQPMLDFRLNDQESSTQIIVLQGRPANYATTLLLPVGYEVYANDHFNIRPFAGVTGQYLFKVGDNSAGFTEDRYFPFTYSGMIGLGFDFKPIYFDFHYEYGFNKYFKNPDTRLNAFCFTLGAVLN